MCISGADNFRKGISPTYKGGRKKSRKPCGYPAFVQWCKDTYEYGIEDTLEADDLMGILATTPGANTIIVSDDKDMLTIPSRLYLPTRGDLIDQTVAAADHAFLTQTLTGDTTDGYSGCPKVGAVTAARILGSRPDWSLVESAFIKSGLTKDDALTQARLARILRHEDWDQKNKVVKLWRSSL
jgi:DNA polymerase-1